MDSIASPAPAKLKAQRNRGKLQGGPKAGPAQPKQTSGRTWSNPDRPSGVATQSDPKAGLQQPEKRALKLAPDCICRLMHEAEAAEVTVPFADVGARLGDVLAKHGTAIVADVLSQTDVADLERVLQLDLEELVDGDAVAAAADASVQAAWQRACDEGVAGWPAASLADVGGRGRFQDRGMPHGRFAWGARLHPKVRHVYEVLHGTSDLVPSCDNSFVANASESEAVKNRNWPHVDQNDHDTRVPCKEWDVYQGLLYLWSSETPHASTTVVWPGSHTEAYAEYMADTAVQRRMDKGLAHFTLISALCEGPGRDRLITGWEAGARRMPVPAGALLLWASRTTHQGGAGARGWRSPFVGSRAPSRRNQTARDRKLRLAALGLPSTHWASLALPHELSGLARLGPVAAQGAAKPEAVRLPLRASIRPQTLVADADFDALWELLKDARWEAPLPEELRALLEKSIKDEFKAVF
eukprot:CAMPEP_0174341952 /NCGR_PEP_ID=MMETSP0810-20121108/25804_1 /TAXON_ID=73025 ORGANISM="Eutreptiella gymnastica-like, Strain CCMP1594" /NCGR_SAMPLE_ID=MMETSP0810 /ASSEMBLY_ACC=CAM_ASM_000659 /LENGTH=468 /DNA_ID=CAMNT_0015463859 /DNA_START=18 /DNA_END=1426 /DNA_ORIENTATION=+